MADKQTGSVEHTRIFESGKLLETVPLSRFLLAIIHNLPQTLVSQVLMILKISTKTWKTQIFVNAVIFLIGGF